jgi:hypothetical protein
MTGFYTKATKSGGLAVLTALIYMLVPANLSASPGNTGLHVTHTGFIMNHASSNHVWVSTLKVTNQSNTAISGPIRVTLTNLSPNAVLINGGNSYITVTLNALAPGETASVPIKFTNSTNGFITFDAVASGGN